MIETKIVLLGTTSSPEPAYDGAFGLLEISQAGFAALCSLKNRIDAFFKDLKSAELVETALPAGVRFFPISGDDGFDDLYYRNAGESTVAEESGRFVVLAKRRRMAGGILLMGTMASEDVSHVGDFYKPECPFKERAVRFYASGNFEIIVRLDNTEDFAMFAQFDLDRLQKQFGT
jgi:hypothetical protein